MDDLAEFAFNQGLLNTIVDGSESEEVPVELLTIARQFIAGFQSCRAARPGGMLECMAPVAAE